MAETPEIALFIARADNGVIGSEGDIPWKIPGEQRHFKDLTMGKPMVMGRKTFDSLPGLLPGRRHIVLTRDRNWSAPGAEVVHSVDEAIRVADAPVIAVIGGAEIYRLFEPIAHRLEITQVNLSPPGDARIDPADPARWRETAREDFPAAGTVPAYSYVTLRRA
ncbi:MAG TPA: dihydrofolate reductase [Sphingobium sp.]|nr:dihydrofolate reductase [Sphingobium sp.]